MPGVITAVKTRHNCSASRQQIGNFTFGFIAPLGAQDNRYRHGRSSPIDGNGESGKLTRLEDELAQTES
jgi:hypothetical protein